MTDRLKRLYLPLCAALGLGLTALTPLALIAGLIAPAQAAGTIRYVAPGGVNSNNLCASSANPCKTIQHAVDVAAPGDEIRVAAGTYTGVSVREGYTQVVYITKSLTLRGGYNPANWGVSDPANHPTTLDAQRLGGVVGISGTITATIEDLRITGGDHFAVGATKATIILRHNSIFSNNGGGVMVIREWPSYSPGAVILSHNSIYSNTGGIALSRISGPVTLSDNHIYNNTPYGGVYLELISGTVALNDNIIAGNEGGGVIVRGSNQITLSGNLIDHNVHDCPPTYLWCEGGVFLHQSKATLSDNIISRNRTSFYGGGVGFLDTTIRLDHNTIISNTAGRDGGGVFDMSNSYAILEGNLIAGNMAGATGGGASLAADTPDTLNGDIILNNESQTCGGGLLISGQASLTNTVIADNRAGLGGSGLCVYFGPTQLWHTTIARNSGGDGSGVYFATSGASSAITLTNTLLVSQTVGITVSAGSTATLNGVLWFGNGANTGGAGTINVTNSHSGNPAFAADGYHLTPASAALNQGINAGVGDDIDGEPRPFGPAPDLGADEGQPAVLVSKQANPPFALPSRPLTYTLTVTNTGFVDLHATITDTLPSQVTPSGPHTWAATIPAFGGVWTGQVTVTVAPDFSGTLTNVVEVGSVEGARGVFTQSVGLGQVVWLPVVWKGQ